MKILLVEDNPGDARLTKELLKEVDTEQFEVVHANRLSGAMDLLKSSAVDAVLLDLGLPDSNGIDTFSTLHASAPRIPIVVLSGVTDESVALKTVQLGAQDYLVKGVFNGSMLSRVIHYAIERQQAEEKVKRVAEEWQTTFDSITDLVSIQDKDFKLVRVNKAYTDAVKVKQEELVGMHCYEVVHGTTAPIGNCPHAQTLETKKAITQEIFEPKLGVYLEVSTSPILNENGETIGTVHIAKNITERKRLEELLRESEKRFRELADLLPQTIFEIDLKGRLTYSNRYGFESTGYTQEALEKGMNVSQLFVPEQREKIQENMGKVWSGGQLDGHEYTVSRKDGSTYPALIYANAIIRNGQPVGGRGIVLDITERKKVEQMKTDFVSFISHQLRTPVAGLLAYINNMLDGITGSLNDKQIEYLNEMRDVCVRNSHLIADLLNISRLERGVISVNIQQVKLRSIVDLAVQEYSKSIKEKGLALNIKGVDQDVSVLADSDKLTEVLKNVIHNALKFTHEGSINIEIMSEGDQGIVKVKDTGIGIPEEVMRDLFKRDKILSDAVAAGGGAGLGLYIAKGFMQLQGGDITVESVRGKESTFTISLPRK